jgi:hypothetical protein
VFKREVAAYPGGATVDGTHGDHILIAPLYLHGGGMPTGRDHDCVKRYI